MRLDPPSDGARHVNSTVEHQKSKSRDEQLPDKKPLVGHNRSEPKQAGPASNKSVDATHHNNNLKLCPLPSQGAKHVCSSYVKIIQVHDSFNDFRQACNFIDCCMVMLKAR